MKNQVINSIKILVVAVALSAGISYATNWVAPAGPPPGNNAQAPVNVGTVNQVKNSNLGLNNLAVYYNATVLGNASVGDFSTDPATGTLKVATLQHTNSTDTHVCAQQDGTLYLCGYTPPPPPINTQCSDGIDNDGDGFVDYPADPGCDDAWDDNESNTVPGTKQQVYSIGLSGNQVSSGDCDAPLGACDDDTFITPSNYIAGSLRIKIIGAGGGGGGGVSYPFVQGKSLSAFCNGVTPDAGDIGPVNALCQLNSGGGGGGGGAYSEFNSVGTQASLQYNVTVGVGGNGGTRRGYGFSSDPSWYNLTNWTNTIWFNPSNGNHVGPGGTDGQDGGDSIVVGPLPQTNVVAAAGGGNGGTGGGVIYNPHSATGSSGTGGVGGTYTVGANVQNGAAGKSGRYTAWPYILDNDLSSSTFGYITGYGSVVHPSPLSTTATGNGGNGGDGRSNGGSGGIGSTMCTNGQASAGGGGGGAATPHSAITGNGCRGGHGTVIFTWQE